MEPSRDPTLVEMWVCVTLRNKLFFMMRSC